MVFSMERWVGKVAIVTGASSGIGKAITEMLVKEGIQVVGLARRLERLENISKNLSGEKGKMFPIKADLSVEEDIINAFRWIKDNLGPVHILINNAGVLGNEDDSTENWNKILQINILGLSIATREAIKDMKANNVEGHIIHINSILGHQVITGRHSMYQASKHAVTALAETVRLQLNSSKPRIKISSISPGLVDTDIIVPNFGERREKFYEEGKLLDAENVAEAVMFTLSTPPNVQVQELIITPIASWSN